MLNRTWNPAGLGSLFPSQHPLQYTKGWRRSQTYSISSGEKQVTYIFKVRKISWEKKNCCLAAFFLGSLYWLEPSDHFLGDQLQCRLQQCSMNGSRNEEPSYTIKSEPHAGMCARAGECCRAVSTEQSSPAPQHPAPPTAQLAKKSHWSVKGENKHW